MNEQQKKAYLERYQRAKSRGVPFFPDVVFKDAVLSLVVLVILIGLILAFGVPLEARADPQDTTYTPRPEWYFLFLFQLLKYFPGQLEVIGVFVLPTLFLLLLFALPFLDRGSKRHPFDRPIVTGATTLVVAGIIFLTIQALVESPPPAETDPGDPIAKLYTDNCAGCHGPTIEVSSTTVNLHEVIAQGGHSEGMPVWSGDLTSNEIDALVGFITSPSGSELFFQHCSACHEAPELVAGAPLSIKQALEAGPTFEPHLDAAVPDWKEVMSQAERTDLLNFLVAPDGQRLFAINCSSCHGRAVSFTGEESALRTTIERGGLHLEMPGWRGRLPAEQVTALAEYVVSPQDNADSESLFAENCSTCHGTSVPRADSVEIAREIILTGGPHETMPVWGDILTDAQLDALISYTLAAAKGTPLDVGRDLFSQYCASCHGEFGEGGINPTRPGDVIAPISSAEYLRTRDNFTLLSVISQGQPNFGMSPFATTSGGPLDRDEIEAIVDYIRSWEQNPPVELPPEIRVEAIDLTGADIFADLCSQCHGEAGQGLIGPALASPEFQSTHDDASIFVTINDGHPATAMIGWGEVLTSEQIRQLVDFVRTLGDGERTQDVSFRQDIQPIFEQSCAICHGSLGGWDSATYDSVMNSGDNGPVVIPGDPDDSLLLQKMEGTQTIGAIMPPNGLLSDSQVALVRQWIEAGAPDN